MSKLDQRNKRVYNEHYALVPRTDVPRSTFHRPSELKLTIPGGYLIPIYVDEVLPGDVHTGRIQIFARLGDLIFPMMDNATIETQSFFVPMRLVWNNSKKFFGEQDSPGDSISYVIPTVTLAPADVITNGIWDYFGIPVGQLTTPKPVNALIPRAYNLIYNEWYRDQNLQTPYTVNKGDSGDTPATFPLLKRGKKHDYFTSALPWPQKNNAVALPLSGMAPVRGIGLIGGTPLPPNTNTAVTQTYVAGDSVNNTIFPESYNGTAGLASLAIRGQTGGTTGYPDVWADLSQASGATINALRLAVQTQKLLETDARGGTRYVEQLKQRWGVTPQDARLQRPEYIGGGTTNLNTSAIAQTTPGTVGSTTPLGSLAGQGVFNGQHTFTCIGHEHGYLFVIASLMSRPTYQQGVHRMWTRSTRYDFATPEFMGLGEQAIRNDEIYATGNATQDAAAFGYQERYAEYRYCNNRIAGYFRSTAPSNIDEWHLAQQFTSLPTLGQTFIIENAAWNRVLAAGSAGTPMTALVDIAFDIKSTRPLTAYGIPGGIKGSF